MFYKKPSSETNIRNTGLMTLKPKYEHLYHSKGVPPEQNSRILGPGHYNIENTNFNYPNSKK